MLSPPMGIVKVPCARSYPTPLQGLLGRRISCWLSDSSELSFPPQLSIFPRLASFSPSTQVFPNAIRNVADKLKLIVYFTYEIPSTD